MGAIALNMPELFNVTWGYKPLDIQYDPVSPKKEYANLGSPYYGTDEKGRSYYMPVRLGGMVLPHPVIRISGRKDIMETKLRRLDGTVKRHVSNGDRHILIRGFIVGSRTEYPEDTVGELRELIDRAEALELRSVISDIFLVTPERKGYDKVVIYDYDFPDARGVQNIRPYELVLKSDKPFDAFIED